MTIDHKLPIFDGHNDVLQSIYLPKTGRGRSFFERTAEGHIDLPRMREGGFAGGFLRFSFGQILPPADSRELYRIQR